MKRLIASLMLAAGLFVVGSFMVLDAQPVLAPGLLGASGGGGTPFTTSCNESAAFLNGSNRVNGQGNGMSTTIAAYYDTMICGMVTDGNWANLDAVYILAAPTQAIANFNLKCPLTGSVCSSTGPDLTNHGATFHANSDYQGNGSSTYVDTGYIPSTGAHYSTNLAVMAAYVLNARSVSSSVIDVGGGDGSTQNYLENYGFSNGADCQMNNLATAVIISGVSNSQGFVVCQLDNSSGIFIAGKQFGSGATASSGAISSTSPTVSQYIGAFNNNGTAGFFIDDKIAAVLFGGSVSRDNISSRVNAFMTSQGINVY